LLKCGATQVQTVSAHEVFRGEKLWHGDVEFFDLHDHTKQRVPTLGAIWTGRKMNANDSLSHWKSRQLNQPILRLVFKL